MDIEKLKEIRKALGIVIISSRSEIGTYQMKRLVQLADETTELIKYLNNPKLYMEELNKVNKSMNLGVKNVQSND